ncbi:LPS translocon maturation chaperone LptM [Thiolinea disciformis]|nr:lipoprotein [Thiolinea disciformis]
MRGFIEKLGLVMILSLVVTACGSKGPLYLPKPDSPPKQERKP